MDSKKDIGLFALMIIFWAINFPLIKIALVYENSFTLLFYRILFALIGMLIIFNRKIIFKVTRKDVPLLLFQSVFMVILFMEFWLMAESTISSALSSILIYMYPVLATVLSILFLKEYYNRFVIIGIIVGFSGIFLIFFNALFSNLGTGVIFAIIAAVSFSVGTVFFKRYLYAKSNETTNFYQFLFALIPSLVIALYMDPSITIFETPPLFILIALIIGLPGTAMAYYIFLYMNRKYRVSTVSSFLFLVPAVSVIFSIFLINESLTYYEYGGLALVSIGIVFSARGNSIGNRTQKREIRSE